MSNPVIFTSIWLCGGVYVDGGTFNMSGGTISGNTATSEGGGVWVMSGGTFTQNGTVSGNTQATGSDVYRQ